MSPEWCALLDVLILALVGGLNTQLLRRTSVIERQTNGHSGPESRESL